MCSSPSESMNISPPSFVCGGTIDVVALASCCGSAVVLGGVGDGTVLGCITRATGALAVVGGVAPNDGVGREKALGAGAPAAGLPGVC